MTSCTAVMIFSSKKVVHFSLMGTTVHSLVSGPFAHIKSVILKRVAVKKRQRKGVTREVGERIEQVCSMRVIQKTYLPCLVTVCKRQAKVCIWASHHCQTMLQILLLMSSTTNCSAFTYCMLQFELTAKSHISSISPQTPVIAIAILASPQVQACEYVLLMGILQRHKLPAQAARPVFLCLPT